MESLGILFIYFIFNLFKVDNQTKFLIFENETSFPRRVANTRICDSNQTKSHFSASIINR